MCPCSYSLYTHKTTPRWKIVEKFATQLLDKRKQIFHACNCCYFRYMHNKNKKLYIVNNGICFNILLSSVPGAIVENLPHPAPNQTDIYASPNRVSVVLSKMIWDLIWDTCILLLFIAKKYHTQMW